MNPNPTPFQKHTVLRYACVECGAGRILVVMSDFGVVDVVYGDNRRQLLREAVRRFPGSGFVPDAGRNAVWVAGIVKRLELGCAVHTVPLDLRSAPSVRAAS